MTKSAVIVRLPRAVKYPDVKLFLNPGETEEILISTRQANIFRFVVSGLSIDKLDTTDITVTVTAPGRYNFSYQDVIWGKRRLVINAIMPRIHQVLSDVIY